MIYFQIKKNSGEIIAENIKDYPHYLRYECGEKYYSEKDAIRSEKMNIDGFRIWLIVIGEVEYIVSNKRFRILAMSYLSASKSFFPYYAEKVKAHSHTLRTIQAQMEQKMEGFAAAKHFRGESYDNQKSNIAEIIKKHTDEASDLICYLNKRIGEIKAHIGVFDLLYNNEFTIDPKKKNVNINKVLQNIIAPFYDEFNIKNVYVKFHIDDNYAKNNQVFLNYKMFNLALSNFLDNAVKYTKPSSILNVNYKVLVNGHQEIIIDMVSCRVEKDEIEKIFEDGYSGCHAINPGDGIGMYAMKKALNLMGMDVRLNPDYSESEIYEGNPFIKNIFTITI